MGLLLERFIDWCYLQSTQATVFASTVAVDARLQRRARELEKKQLLTEVDSNRHSIAFLLGDTPANTTSPDVVYVRALPASRPYDENQRRKHEDLPASAQLGLHTARMETEGMPASGWRVNVCALTCPCRFHMKFGICTHVLSALNARGHIDLSGRERLVYRGPNKKRTISSGRQGPGRPTSNGHALHIN
ncbi:hypothetical protein F444_16693 [Phytophthora nicotianae P1976]|uniref:SWIM-type domain-containing protein n=1 Tax=Phytophthora nicotianae P1976 TaxID=1317066 RepID=A0A080ZHF4_PHYNI|nr:hypothetical protein F444_16693 [Phytophthora nicotianae P1976]